MSLCVAQDCVNEGFGAEPVLGARFCFTHWNEAKSAFSKDRAPRKNKSHYGKYQQDLKIYFLKSGKYMKIGSSHNPLDRVKLIRSGGDGARKPLDVDLENVECIGWHPGTRRDERRLHEQFAKHNAAGEWFHYSPELELEIRNLIYIKQRAMS